MTYPRFFLLIPFIAGFCACEKPQPSIVDVPILPEDTLVVPPPPVDSHIIGLGKVSVLKNGQIWAVPFIAGFSNLEGTFALIGEKLYPNGVLQSFSIRDIPCKPGKFDLEFWPSLASLYPNRIPSTHFGMLYDGDQFIGSFLLDSLSHPFLIRITAPNIPAILTA